MSELPQGNAIDPRIIAKYVLQYQQQADTFMRYQIDASDELNQLHRDLLGLEYDREKGKYVRSEDKDQLINEKGMNAILSFTRSRISKISSLSNLDDEEITKICLCFANDLTYFLVRHFDEYEVKSLQTVSNIIGLCDDLFFTTLKKARNAGERDSLRKTYIHRESTEHVTNKQESQGKKFLANPFASAGGN